MDILINIILFIVIIGTIILIHEAGHFYFAKKAGILCREFSIGMGPALFKKQIGETTFAIRAIPIGGYVSMAGEDIENAACKVGDRVGLNFQEGKVSEIVLNNKMAFDVEGEILEQELYSEFGQDLFIKILTDDGKEKSYFILEDAFYVFSPSKRYQITPYSKCFESKSIWARFKTIAAGPLMNFVLALIIYFVFFCASGTPNYNSKIIKDVTSNAPAEYAGVRAGDELVSLNGKELDSWSNLTEYTSELTSENVDKYTLVVKRDGKEMSLNINPYIYIQSIGISNSGLTGAEMLEKPTSITSNVVLGNTSIRYIDKKISTKETSGMLSRGDIITGIRYVEISKSKNPLEDLEALPITKISTWSELMEIFSSMSAADVEYEFYDTETKETKLTPAMQSYSNEVLKAQEVENVEVRFGVEVSTHFDLGQTIINMFKQFSSDFMLVFNTLVLLIHPSEVRQVGVGNLSGVVGIFNLIANVREQGGLQLLVFVGMLSVNIGVMNLLPIPALDGGRLVFIIYEAITRKKPNKKFENLLNNIVFLLLLALMIYVTYNDILKAIR